MLVIQASPSSATPATIPPILPEQNPQASAPHTDPEISERERGKRKEREREERERERQRESASERVRARESIMCMYCLVYVAEKTGNAQAMSTLNRS